MKNEKGKPKKERKMELKSGLSRREFIVGTTAGFVTLSLGDLLLPSLGKAATPKKGGKLVYAGSYKNSKHKPMPARTFGKSPSGQIFSLTTVVP